MSPEQAGGDRALDGRSDIYSLGCVLYEMLTGEPPHTGPTVQAVIAKLLADKVRPVTELRSTVPVAVAAALEVALAKLPADRFESAVAFSEALQGQTTGMSLGMMSARQQRVSRDPRVIGFAGAAVVFAVLAFWGWVGRPVSLSEGPVAYLPLALVDPYRARSTWSDGVRLSPDGRRLAYYTGDGWYVMHLETGASMPASQEVVGLGLLFSPSGDSVALTTTSRNQQIYLSDLATGRASRLADCCSGVGDWDRNGWIYHKDSAFNLVRTNIDGRQEVLHRYAGLEAGWVANPTSVAGGRAVLFSRSSSSDLALADIAVKAVPDGEVRTLMRGVDLLLAESGHLLAVQPDGRVLAARFDEESLSLVGAPVQVLEGLEVRAELSGYSARASMSLSREGTLLFVRRGPVTEDSVVVVDRNGRLMRPEKSWGGWLNQVARANRWLSVGCQPPSGVELAECVGSRPRRRCARRLTFSLALDYYPRFLEGAGILPSLDTPPLDGRGTFTASRLMVLVRRRCSSTLPVISSGPASRLTAAGSPSARGTRLARRTFWAIEWGLIPARCAW